MFGNHQIKSDSNNFPFTIYYLPFHIPNVVPHFTPYFSLLTSNFLPTYHLQLTTSPLTRYADRAVALLTSTRCQGDA